MYAIIYVNGIKEKVYSASQSQIMRIAKTYSKRRLKDKGVIVVSTYYRDTFYTDDDLKKWNAEQESDLKFYTRLRETSNR